MSIRIDIVRVIIVYNVHEVLKNVFSYVYYIKKAISFLEVNVDVFKGALRLREKIDNIDFSSIHT